MKLFDILVLILIGIMVVGSFTHNAIKVSENYGFCLEKGFTSTPLIANFDNVSCSKLATFCETSKSGEEFCSDRVKWKSFKHSNDGEKT